MGEVTQVLSGKASGASSPQVAEETALDALHAHAVSNLDELAALICNLSQFVHRATGETVPSNPPESATDRGEVTGVLHLLNGVLQHQQAKLNDLRDIVRAIERIT